MKYNNGDDSIFNQIQANILHIQNTRQLEPNNGKHFYKNGYGNGVGGKSNPPSRKTDRVEPNYSSSGKLQVKATPQEKPRDKSNDRKLKQKQSYPQPQREITQRVRHEMPNANRGYGEHNTIENCGSRTPTKYGGQIRKTPTHTPMRPRTPDCDKGNQPRIQRTPDGKGRQRKMNITTNEYELHNYGKKSPLRKKETVVTATNRGNQHVASINANANAPMYTHCNSGNSNSHLYTNSNAVITTAGNKSKRPQQGTVKANNCSQKPKNVAVPSPWSSTLNKQQHVLKQNLQQQQQPSNVELRKQHSQGRMYFTSNTTTQIDTKANNPHYNQPYYNPVSQKQLTTNGYSNNSKYNYNNTHNPVFESFGKPMGIPYPKTETQRIPNPSTKTQPYQAPQSQHPQQSQPSKRINDQKDLPSFSQRQSAPNKYQPGQYFKLPEESPKIDFNELDQFSPPFTGQLNVNYNDPRLFSPVLTTNYTNIELSKDKHSTLNPSDNSRLINDFISKINPSDKKYSTIEYQKLKFDYHRKTSSFAEAPSLNYNQYKQI